MKVATHDAARPMPRVLTTRKAFLIISFLCFLYPITDFEGRSINYSFALFPVFTALLDGKVRKPPVMILHMIAIFTVILVLAILYQLEFLDLSVWRLVSFLLFMTLFLFVFVKIDSEMIAAFKIAIVLISAFFSLVAAIIFLGAGDPFHYEAKDVVGSQRFGFIHLLGFWIVLFFRPSRKLYVVGKYATMGVIFAGLFLTFSRSSIVALLVSVGLFALVSSWQWLLRPTMKSTLAGSRLVVGLGLLVFLTYHYLPLTFEFYGDRLFSLISSGSVMTQLMDPETSEGARIRIIETALDFVVTNPLTGTGYLGVWVLPDAFAGSAHNQYIDVLLRTGFIGFMAYSVLILRVLKYLYRCERALFWGLIGVLVYGLFHETFKESQGGFVLAFLVGMMAQFRRDRTGGRLARHQLTYRLRNA